MPYERVDLDLGLGEDRLKMRVVHPEHCIVTADGERLVLGTRPSQLLERNLLVGEGRDAGEAVGGPVVTGGARELTHALHRRRPSGPVVTPTETAVQLADGRSDPVRFGLDERHPEVREALEDAAEKHLPEGPARVEGVLEGQRHDGGEPRRPVGRCPGATVLTDRQPDLDAGGPHRIERGIEEEGPTGEKGGHHDATQAMLLGPMDVRHGQFDVVERDERLSGSTARRLRAEVGQPAVVGQTSLALDLRVGEGTHVVCRPRLERQSVREEHLGHDALALHVLEAEIRIPLRGRVQSRAQIAALGRTGCLFRPGPVIEGVEESLLDVVPVVAP